MSVMATRVPSRAKAIVSITAEFSRTDRTDAVGPWGLSPVRKQATTNEASKSNGSLVPSSDNLT